MMKKSLLVLLFLFSLLSFGQQRNQFVVEWRDKTAVPIGKSVVTIPQFQPANIDFDNSTKQLYLNISLPSSSAANPSSLQVTNIVYESITVAELGDLSVNALPSAPNPSLHSVKAREDWFIKIKLSPIIKDGSGYKKIKSFNYSYEPDRQGSNLRNTSDFTGISNSVLASGQWYRFYVEKSGVYKISRGFLQQLGLDTNTDPRKIKVYGNGGRMLPLLNATEYPADLTENAITFIGQEDGQFDSADYILFYAEGVDNWSEENGTHNNLYSDRSYYYVTSGGNNGKRIGVMGQPSAPATMVTSTFDEYQYHEQDLVSIARLGRKWHGEAFNVNNEQEFEFVIPDIEIAPVSVTVSAAANSVATTSMAVTANDAAIGTMTFNAPGTHDAAREDSITSSFNPAGGTITVKLSYSNGGVPGSNAWLDYIILKAKRKLRGNGDQFRFTLEATAENIGVIEYQFANAASVSEVWDITNIYDVGKTVNAGAQSNFSFKAAMGEARKYIAVSPNDYYSPQRESNARVVNQNIKGNIFNNSQGQFQNIDYIIVTPASLNSVAERLANMHRNISNLNVRVVNLENIYHEFSSGKQDIGAIRNFVKYVYNNASSPANRIKYLNLFGDASFDFKDRIPNNTNIVPIFHRFDPNNGVNYNDVSTFVSDDFFGLMDPNEGRMQGGNGEGLDIAVGRMLVSSTSQANEMVDKVIEYKTEESYGRWRNDYIIITDDLDNNGEAFVSTMEGIADDLEIVRPFVNIKKIHADAYVQVASAGGERYPEAKEQLIRAINYGSLVVNYLGHGGEDGIASERLFEKGDAENLTNRFKYPLFITATCELTKFDNPYRPTAGEFIYWNPTGGAIAMVTTTRSIFTSAAYSFNEDFSERLYSFNDPSGTNYPSMAEALRLTKVNSNQADLIRVISFIGDPALELAIPKPKVELTEINDVPLAESTDVLEALSYVKLGGRVTDVNGNLLTGYNGEVAVTVFDKNIERTTLGNDGVTEEVGGVDVVKITPFNTLGETIFRGNATVNNGVFEFGFVVPKDIKIPVGEGRVSLYAKRNNVLEDQTGQNTVIRIGGINENAAADNIAPRVKLYMNDESFVNGGITNESPILLAFLEDENGMNTASGIGHDMIAILDGDETNQFLLNDYYESDVDDYTRGSLRFPFSNLEKGLHTLTFRAWDVYNNPVNAEIQFVVAGDEGITLEKVLNYPNPFVSYTEFWFSHNRPFEPLDVQVQIFTVTGKVVKTINQSVSTDGFLCRDIKWDGRDDYGDRIGKGVYIYKLTVRSSTTNKTAEKYEKLVLL